MVALITLGLGIGANSALFSVIYGVLLRPLPFKASDRLVLVGEMSGDGTRSHTLSTRDYLGITKRSSCLEDIGAYEVRDFDLTGTEEPEHVQAQAISSGLFGMLGIRPDLGRDFQSEEHQPGHDRVAILSQELWRRRFRADKEIVGRSLTIDNRVYLIAGVMPASFQLSEKVDLWLPMSFTAQDYEDRSSRLSAIAHVKRMVTLDQAQSELSQITTSLGPLFPGMAGASTVRLDFLRDVVVNQVRRSLFVLWGAVSFVLLISIANVVNLMIARATDRRREMGIRLALGASRARVIRLFLAESLILSVLGGFVGLIAALWGKDALLAVTPDRIPRLSEVGVNGPVLLFTLSVAIVAGVVMGFAPGLQYTGRDLELALRHGSAEQFLVFSLFRRNRVRALLVVPQIALSLMLMVGAGLMIESYVRLSAIDPGFDPDHLATATVFARQSESRAPEHVTEFFSQVLNDIRELPGVESVAGTTGLPLSKSGGLRSLTIEGAPMLDPNPTDYSRAGGAPIPPMPPGGPNLMTWAVYSAVTPGYFRAMRIRIERGREFTKWDNEKAPPVVIISEEMSRHFWPGGDPIGKRIKSGPPDSPWITVIGIAANIRHFTLEAEARPEMYFPWLQPIDSIAHYMSIVVRTTRRPERVLKPIRDEIWRVDKDQPIQQLATMNNTLAEVTAPRRFNMLIFGTFAALAVFLAMVGIYGVMSHVVSQRTRELGIRLALGALRRQVLLLVMKEGAALAVVGLMLGLAGASALSRILTSMLFEVGPTDFATYAVVSALLTAASLAACFVPARRATRVDPVTALRCE